jgi:hypothetical protein
VKAYSVNTGSRLFDRMYMCVRMWDLTNVSRDLCMYGIVSLEGRLYIHTARLDPIYPSTAVLSNPHPVRKKQTPIRDDAEHLTN